MEFAVAAYIHKKNAPLVARKNRWQKAKRFNTAPKRLWTELHDIFYKDEQLHLKNITT